METPGMDQAGIGAAIRGVVAMAGAAARAGTAGRAAAGVAAGVAAGMAAADKVVGKAAAGIDCFNENADFSWRRTV
jgi:type IV secretory pathway TrbL component